ncbi:MAG: M24 family metallopeptidase, partial [Acidobacteria bacterium]|nr:M24 family metallopeptidase [Acidobacteriota bacterium]
PGEREAPESIRKAYDTALEVQRVLRRHIRPGRRGDETLDELYRQVKAAGWEPIEFNKPNAGPSVDVTIGMHPVGNTGHGVGPSITTWQPLQSTFVIEAPHIFSFEYFTYVPIPEWGGRKLRIPIEDDALVTERGVEWLHPAARRVLVIR